MKIFDPIHALILFDQKKLIPRKTILKSSSGSWFRFIRVDTQLNWPRIIVEDAEKNQLIFTTKECRQLELCAEEPGIVVENFESPP